jgi:hypothetical protein
MSRRWAGLSKTRLSDWLILVRRLGGPGLGSINYTMILLTVISQGFVLVAHRPYQQFQKAQTHNFENTSDIYRRNSRIIVKVAQGMSLILITAFDELAAIKMKA